MAIAVSLPACMTPWQKLTYLISQEVNSIRYLCCFSSSQIFLQSISPQFIDGLSDHILDGGEVKGHSNRAMIAVESSKGRAAIVNALVQCRQANNYIEHVGIRDS